MNTTGNVAKLVTVFIAGIVVALGGALLYVRGTENGRAQAVAQVSSKTPGEVNRPEDRSIMPQRAAETPQPTGAKSPEVLERHATHPAARSTPLKAGNFDRQPGKRVPDSGQDATPVAQNQPPRDPAVPALPMSEPAPQPTPAKVAVNEPTNYATPPQPQTVTLASGTKLNIRLGETVSTGTNYAGDTFKGTLAQPIVVNDLVIADKGSRVLGRVTTAERAGRVKGLSELQLVLTEVSTTDGQQIKIQTSTISARGSSSKGEDAAKVAGGAALGAIIGAVAGGGKGAAIGAGTGGAAGTGVVLATRGKEAAFPVESSLSFQLSSPVTITEQLH